MNQPARTIPLRIVVLDDDPTGSQTVHGNLLLLKWGPQQLREALTDAVPFFYVLTNTRAMTSERARQTVHDVVAAVTRADEASGQRLLFVSRSDSTLRGHFPVEVDEIRQCLGAGGAPDALFVVPAFFEGGRFTRNGTHYLVENGQARPCHETEFARDSVFGYASSHLPAWIQEKTAGRVPQAMVRVLDRGVLHDPPRLRDFIGSLHGNAHVAVDAEDYRDLEALAAAVREAMDKGARFLFQSAASMVKALTATPDKPLLTAGDIGSRPGPGLVVAGSHVSRTSRQIETLLQLPGVQAVEIDVEQALASQARRDEILGDVHRQVSRCAQAGLTPVVMTSRREVLFADPAARQAAGETVANLLAAIVQDLPYKPAFVVLKGGITSHVVMDRGLHIRVARVLGQILPGVSVIRLGGDHPMGAMPLAIFPGNVGDDDALREVLLRMRTP